MLYTNRRARAGSSSRSMMRRHMMPNREISRRIGVAAGVGLALVLAGCMGERAAAPSPHSPASILGSISGSPMNVIMAVGDTFSVHVSGRALDGSSVTSFDSVTYVLNSIVDTARVSVAPTGLVTGRSNSGTSPVLLNIFAYKNGSAAADQIIIQVTPTSFAATRLSIQPGSSDSTRLAIGSGKNIYPVIQNADGSQTVPNPQLRFTTSAADMKKIGCYYLYLPYTTAAFTYSTLALQLNGCAGGFGLNQINAMALGTAWVHASALVYGVMLQDSVQYTLTHPFTVYAGAWNNNLEMICGACDATIASGGTIIFQNGFASGLGMTVTFTFEHPDAATVASPAATVGDSVGNVTTLQSFEQSPRVFRTPGVYKWTETVSGATPPFQNRTFTGTITVQ